MKYWIFTGSDAVGPYSEEELRRQPGFSAQTTLICPNGAGSADQWKPAKDYLAAAPAATPQASVLAPSTNQNPENRLGLLAEDAFDRLAKEKSAAPAAAPAAEERLGAGAEDAFERLNKQKAAGGDAPGGGGAAAVAAPAAGGPPDEDPIDRVFRERREATMAARKAAEKRAMRFRLASFTSIVGIIVTLGALWALKVYVSRKLASTDVRASLRAHANRFSFRKKKPAEPAPAASAASAGAGKKDVAAPAAAPAPTPVPKLDSTAEKVVSFARDFPLQSRPRKRPSAAEDVLAPQRWTPAKTLGQLYEQLALEALASDAGRALERQGHTAAEGDKEIRRSAQLWKKHAQAFLDRRRPVWTAEPSLAGMVVEARLKDGAEETTRRFLVDPAARTLKPEGLAAWFDVDPHSATRWASKYLRLSEDLDEKAAGPQTPTYTQAAAAAAAAPAAKPASGRVGRASRPIARKAKPAPEEEEYDDPTAPSEPKAQAIAEPPPRPATAPATRAKAAPTQAQTPPSPPAASASPSPTGGQAKPGAPAAPRKSVADMSVEELQSYLNRDKK